MQMNVMPFKILAMAPFQMTGEIPWKKAPIAVDRMEPDAAIGLMDVSIFISLPGQLCPAGGLDLQFKRLKDFHPDGLIQNNPFLSHLLEAKLFLEQAGAKQLSDPEIHAGMKQWPDLPFIQIQTAQKKSLEAQPPKPQTNTIDNILDMVALPGEAPEPVSESDLMTPSGLTPSGLTPSDLTLSGPGQIDAIIQQILNLIFEDENFRSAEAAWRGLKLLLQQGPSRESDVCLEIMPVALNTLEETISSLTTRLINNLPSLIIIDLPFDNSSFCIGLLEKIANFSETLMVPTVVQISPGFMQLESWNDIKRLSFIPHHLEQPAYAKWQALKNQHAANWLAVSCNRFLIRYPYGNNNLPRKCTFKEKQLPWTGSVWAVAGLIAQSFVKTGWPARFTDWQNIQIENLALHSSLTSGEIPTEVIFDQDRIDQFKRAGIIPLAAIANKDIVFTPKEVTMTGVSLAYQLFVSRITQFVLWCKDHFTDELSGEELESRLKKAFIQFWEKSGHSGPEFLDITAGNPDADGRIPLHIELQPSRKILSKGESIVMDFFW
jgi:type VI secretion system protein ImpC